MQKFRTHYDNLKVSKDAPPEVIRAAYRSLCQKYHPDKNQNDQEAKKIMTIINGSYATLSDAVQKRIHDEWIASMERKSNQSSDDTQTKPQNSAPFITKPFIFLAMSHIRSIWGWYVFLVGIIFLVLVNQITPKQPPVATQYEADASPPPKLTPVDYDPFVKPVVEQSFREFNGTLDAVNHDPSDEPLVGSYKSKPSDAAKGFTATNEKGKPWPQSSGYIHGYKRLYVNGLSNVIVDNSRNDSAVFLKLFSLKSNQPLAIRVIYIKTGGKFTLTNVPAGNYDIRYQNLVSGDFSKTDPFNLSEIQTDEGTRFSNITMTLYKVQNGNMHTYPIDESSFNSE